MEDSYLLLEEVKRYAYGKVLDLGTGSGVQAIEAAKSSRVKAVTAVDIDKKALETAKNNASDAGVRVYKKIKFIYSDLFKKLKKQRFDTIIFNPPYLPEDKNFREKAIHGGKKGYELIERFFSAVNDYLAEDGIILLVFSSLTKKEKVNEATENYGFEKELLNEKRIFFETLYVYLARKSELLKKLNKKRIRKIKKFAKGHRGIVYAGRLKNSKAAIKIERKDAAAKGRIRNEIKWLEVLNKHGIGPKIIYANKDYFICEFIEGRFILDFIENSNKNRVTAVLKELFKQCFAMDKLRINKEEMHHPLKHVIVNEKGKVILVDFERAHKTKKPKNVTQLCQFVIKDYVRKTLKNKGATINKEKVISAAKNYRKNMSNENFNKILQLIK
jgi:HemK-related putative methylase